MGTGLIFTKHEKIRPVPIFIRKLAAGALFVALVSTAALLLARRAPGDYTDTLRAARVSSDTIERERRRLYLDRSLPDLSLIWLSGLARLDLGTSYRFDRPVRSLLVERAPRTFALVGAALVLAFAAGIVWGTSLARGPRLIRAPLSALASLSLAMPSIVVLFALLLVATRTGWLGAGDQSIVIPLLGIAALVVPAAAALARMHAQALDEALVQPWAIASAARGVPQRQLVWKRGMRVAATRVASIAPLVAANVIGASLLVEVVTGWAGLGRLTLDALVARDVFLVAGCTATVSAAVALLAILSDAVVVLLDPRIAAHEIQPGMISGGAR
ncbi:MAG: ABC transporter permease [Vicinamibacterales bacterium]